MLHIIAEKKWMVFQKSWVNLYCFLWQEVIKLRCHTLTCSVSVSGLFHADLHRVFVSKPVEWSGIKSSKVVVGVIWCKCLIVLPVDATVSIVKLTSVGHFFLECVACLQADIISVASRTGNFIAFNDMDSLFVVLTVWLVQCNWGIHIKRVNTVFLSHPDTSKEIVLLDILLINTSLGPCTEE